MGKIITMYDMFETLLFNHFVQEAINILCLRCQMIHLAVYQMSMASFTNWLDSEHLNTKF